jgi:hypothetical protein
VRGLKRLEHGHLPDLRLASDNMVGRER